MGIPALGVYLAFDDAGEGGARDSAGVGPFDEIVLRGARAVGERAGLGQIIAVRDSKGRWMGVDGQQRGSSANGAEDAGQIHVTASGDRLFVRFFDDDAPRAAPVPDLGPFARVVVATHDIRADDRVLAVRVSRMSPWLLTDLAGTGLQGSSKDALAFVASANPGTRRQATASAVIERAEPKPKVASPPADDSAPSVWVDRVRPAPEIYISRPDTRRK